MERFSFEKAQEEAATMQKKVSSGEAKNYDEAEQIIEKEAGRKEMSEMRGLYRGIWADALMNGEELPVGGSMFDTELTTKLKLDFNFFDDQLERFTKENIDELYEQNKVGLIGWLESLGADIDPYLYYVCAQTQWKMQQLLKIDTEEPSEESSERVKRSMERQRVYAAETAPALSELRGKTECAERAALGQYLLQRIHIPSSYVSGITMHDGTDISEYPEDHSFLVLRDQNMPEKTFVFDIARPRSQHNVPRVLETDVPMTYDVLKDHSDLLIGATEALQKGRMWFGVGEPVSMKHHILTEDSIPGEV